MRCAWRKALRDGIHQAYQMIGFCHIIRRLSDLTEDEGFRFEPSRVIDVKLDDRSENVEQVVNDVVTALDQNHIRDLVRARGLVWTK